MNSGDPDVGTGSGGQAPRGLGEAGSHPRKDYRPSGETALVLSDEKRRQVDCTADLVTAYNASDDDSERSAILNRLQRYHKAFEQQTDELTCGSAAVEYAKIAQLHPTSEVDSALVKAVLRDLSARLKPGEFPDADVAKSLHGALAAVDPAVFEDHTELLQMAHCLLECFNSKVCTTRKNFQRRRATFLALHELCILIHKTARHEIATTDKERLQEALAEARKLAGTSLSYFPLRFCFKLLDQALHRFEVEEPAAPVRHMLQCLSLGTCGVLHICRGLRAFATVDIDPSSLEEGFKRLKDAIAKLRVREKEWYDVFEALTRGRVKAVAHAEKFDVFKTGFEVTMDFQRRMQRGEDRKALRFGIIQELQELSIQGKGRDARQFGVANLADLGTRGAVEEGWADDADIFEALLEALSACAVLEEHIQAVGFAVDAMEHCSRPGAKEALRRWVRRRRRKNAAPTPKRDEAATATSSKTLFVETSSSPVSVLQRVRVSVVDQLKAQYQAQSFVKVRPLFEGGREKHIGDLNFEVLFYKKEEIIDKRKQDEVTRLNGGVGGEKDHTLERYVRRQRVAQPVDLADFFKPRSLRADDPPSDVWRVLLYGDPGAGKTCMSRTIAHKWSCGTKFQEFEKVYLFVMREVHKSRQDSRTSRFRSTLANAIASMWLAHLSDEDYAASLVEIERDLNHETTLLVIDGLDERDEAGERMLDLAKCQSCKILMLSRPYNISNERSFVDIELECVGLSRAQVERFVRDELPGESAHRLLQYLKANLALQQVVYIPITLNILCGLWEDRLDMLTSNKPIGLTFLYNEFVKFVWERYTERPGALKKLRNLVVRTLEEISLSAIEKGEILISQSLVMDHADSHNHRKALKDTGFLMLHVEGKEYKFPHLTFQEFFAGRCVARLLFSEDSDEKERARTFVAQTKYAARFKGTFAFVCGDLRESSRATNGFLGVLEIVQSSPCDEFGLCQALAELGVIDGFLGDGKNALDESITRTKTAKRIFDLLETLLTKCDVGDCLWEAIVERLTEMPCAMREFENFIRPLGDEKMKAWLKLNTLQFVRAIRHSPQALLRFAGLAVGIGRDEDRRLRFATTKAIGELAKTNSEIVSWAPRILLDSANDEAPLVRQASMEAIRELVKANPCVCSEVEVALVGGVKDAEGTVRRSAVMAIKELATTNREAATSIGTTLEKATGDRDWSARYSAMVAIGELMKTALGASTIAPSTLVRAVNDDNINMRMAALIAIGEFIQINPEAAVAVSATLVARAKDSDWNVRCTAMVAIEALAKANPDAGATASAALIEAANDPDWNVRCAALGAIKELAAAELRSAASTADALELALKDPVGHVRRAATVAMRELTKANPKAVAAALKALLERGKDAETSVRREAIPAIGEYAKRVPKAISEASKVLLEAAEDGDSQVRRTALVKLGELAKELPELTPRASEALIDGVRNADERRHGSAMDAVGSLSKIHRRLSVDVLTALLSGAKKTDWNSRRAAVAAIGELARMKAVDAENVQTVVEGTDDGDWRVRVAAITAIGALLTAQPERISAISRALIKTAKDGDACVRCAAMRVICRLGRASPNDAARATQALIAGADDASIDVRKVARAAVGVLIKKNPESAAAMSKVFLEGATQVRCSLRRLATAAIGLLMRTNPDAAAGAAKDLLEGTDRSDVVIRRLAMAAMGEAIRRTDETDFDVVDGEAVIRRVTLESIRKIPLRTLFASDLDHASRDVATVLGVKLVNTPVVVAENVATGELEVEDKSTEEVVNTSGLPPHAVNKLISLARESVEAHYPGISEALRLARGGKLPAP